MVPCGSRIASDFTNGDTKRYNWAGMVMTRVGILYHPMKPAACALAKKLAEFLGARGLVVWSCSAWEVETARAQVNGTDLILSVGGDGTILRAAEAVVPGPTPIVGINLGQLGFMTELNVAEAESKILALLAGEGRIDERSMLEAKIYPAGEGQGLPGVFYALNDVVLARGIAQIVYIETSIDDEPLTTYKADGVIVATATGSTGYALAAGGPILHPQSREILLLPILPHLGLAYPMVLPSTATVKLRHNSPQPVMLSIDGHINRPLAGGVTITVKHSANTVRFLRVHPETAFYSSLEQKLKGK